MAIVRKASRESSASALAGDNNISLASASQQPFIFRQFIFREIVTPTKKGNVSMKEVSFSTYSDDKWTTVSQKPKGFSFSPKQMLMAPKETFCQSLASFGTSLPNNKDLAKEKSNNLRSRSKTLQPIKKLKVDSTVDQKITKERRHTGRKSEQRQNPQKLHWNYICMISLIPVILLLSFSIYIFKDRNMQLTFNMNHLQSILNERVFGQKEAISSILNIIETTINKDLEKNKEMPVILVTGPSGVGKSYTSSIIANGFPPPGISDLILFPLPPPKHTVQKCSEKGYNLIVLDSLYHHSMNNSINWVKQFLNEALWQNKPVIVLLIFNVQVWNDPFAVHADDTAQENLEATENVIYSDLKKHGLETFHVHFRSLSEEDLKRCVRAALQRKGVGKDHITEKYVNMIANSINHREEGCKRVWSQTASAVLD